MKTKSGFGKIVLVALCSAGVVVVASAQEKPAGKTEKVVVTGVASGPEMTPTQDSTTDGSVTLAGGQTIKYQAVAGTLTVGGTDKIDTMLALDGKMLPDTGEKAPEKPEDAPEISHC